MRNTFPKLDQDLSSTLWLPVLGLVLAASVAASCGGDSTGSPGGGGSGGSSAGTAGNSAGGNSGGGTTGSGGTSGSGVAGTTGSGGTGGNGSGGNSTAGSGGSSTAGSGGNTGSGGNSTAGSGGSGGSGGGTAGVAQAGRGGASAGSGGASAGRGGTTGSAGTTGTGGTTTGCPTNATFCSGFETAGLPAGAVYKVDAAPGDWSRDFAVDTTQKRNGNSSLLVKNSTVAGSSGSAYRMLAVPVPAGGAFWVRFFVRSDMPMGSVDHNAFAGPSTSEETGGTIDEFAEDVGISFNTNDNDLRWPTGYGRVNGTPTPYVLPAMTWHCVELSYDLTGRRQQLYIGGTLLIDAGNYPPSGFTGPFTTFKFGFRSFHGPPRQMWYDDVAVAPTRIGGCQ